MTALVWDQPGERRYETGVDHGVLYLPSGDAAAWNGLVSVVETLSRTLKSAYIDGVKYLDHVAPGAYSAKLQAFTYPDELDTLMGSHEITPGVVAHDQAVRSFNLSYRTLIANDIEGEDFGYKLHLVYNVTAVPADRTYTSIAGVRGSGGSRSSHVYGAHQFNAFEWTLTGVPDRVNGIRPTSHISIDSRRIDPTKLDTLENMLYGSDTANPQMPSLVALAGMT